MFKNLLNTLHKEFEEHIYVPDALYPLIRQWVESKSVRPVSPTARLLWKSKYVLPYNEDKILRAYQSCPIHIPERILEKSIVIEASLQDRPQKEEVVEEKPKKQQTKRKLKKRRLF